MGLDRLTGFFDLSTGQMERVHYNPMGVPSCLPSGAVNGDGKTDALDYEKWCISRQDGRSFLGCVLGWTK